MAGVPSSENTIEPLIHYLINEVYGLKQEIILNQEAARVIHQEVKPVIEEDLHKTNQIVRWVKLIGSFSFITSMLPFLFEQFKNILHIIYH